jgi:hypothetical protein
MIMDCPLYYGISLFILHNRIQSFRSFASFINLVHNSSSHSRCWESSDSFKAGKADFKAQLQSEVVQRGWGVAGTRT